MNVSGITSQVLIFLQFGLQILIIVAIFIKFLDLKSLRVRSEILPYIVGIVFYKFKVETSMIFITMMFLPVQDQRVEIEDYKIIGIVYADI